MNKIIKILEEVRIEQDDKIIILEKGDRIRILEEKKIEEAKYPQDWANYRKMAEHLAEAIDRFGGPMECHYYPEDFDYGEGSFEITFNRQRFALDLYKIQ